jgi:ribosomal protein S27AE
MLVFGIAIAFALAAADRARRREASVALWGALAGVVCVAAGMFGGLILVVPAGIAMVVAAAKLGTTTRECPNCGKTTPIAVLACPHCGASPRTKFLSGI